MKKYSFTYYPNTHCGVRYAGTNFQIHLKYPAQKRTILVKTNRKIKSYYLQFREMTHIIELATDFRGIYVGNLFAFFQIKDRRCTIPLPNFFDTKVCIDINNDRRYKSEVIAVNHISDIFWQKPFTTSEASLNNCLFHYMGRSTRGYEIVDTLLLLWEKHPNFILNNVLTSKENVHVNNSKFNSFNSLNEIEFPKFD